MSAYQDLRVVDLSRGTAGAMAAMLLGDLAAQVVRIEPPGANGGARGPGDFALNRNKELLALDLATPDGLAQARELLAGADVAIFDHAPGELERLGLDAAAMTKANPALVHAWMPPYGVSGRWSSLPAHSLLLNGLTGIAFRQGANADQPVHLVLPLAAYAQGVLGAAAIGAALHERGRSGRGQGVTVSGLHAAGEIAPPVRIDAVPPLPRGTPPGSNPRYRLYRCADGEWFFLGTLFTPFYRKAFEALGFGDLFEVMEIDMVAARELLSGIFETQPREEWLTLLREHDVPCAPVGRREAWFAGQVVADAGLRQVLSHPDLGEVAMPGPPAEFSATPASIRSLPRPIARAPVWAPRAFSAGEPRTGGPLAGVRVLNLGTVIAGAYAGAILSNLGAEVIKIEPREADPFRSDGAQFVGYNRGSRGLGLDLKQAEARELFLDLARQADVVIDNYRLGVRKRLGIDYAALKAVNPRIISCSINAYGGTGPRASSPGFDPLLQAEGGMMAAQGGEGDPILHTIAVNDVATAAVVSASVIAALNARARTGEGQEVLTSLMAQSLLFQLVEMVDYPGRPANPLGGEDCLGISALHRYYACADGWIGMVCEGPEEAVALGRVLGVEMGASPLAEARDGPLAARIAEALAGRPRGVVLDELDKAGVAVAPVLRADEVYDDPWLGENGFLEAWRHERLGPVQSVAGYATFDRTPGGFEWPTPDLAQNSAEVLAAFGLDRERIEALFAGGAVFGGGDMS